MNYYSFCYSLLYKEHERPDCSIEPSFTKLCLPYEVICRKRYSQDRRKHGEALLKEMKMTELLHTLGKLY